MRIAIARMVANFLWVGLDVVVVIVIVIVDDVCCSTDWFAVFAALHINTIQARKANGQNGRWAGVAAACFGSTNWKRSQCVHLCCDWQTSHRIQIHFANELANPVFVCLCASRLAHNNSERERENRPEIPIPISFFCITYFLDGNGSDNVRRLCRTTFAI